jgi:hypothetical protein
MYGVAYKPPNTEGDFRMIKSGLAVALAVLLAACDPAIRFYPRRAKYASMEQATKRAIILYDGDLEQFGRCEAVWIGDIACSPRCEGGAVGGIQRLAARHGATHVKLIESESERTGTKITSTAVGTKYVASETTEAHDTYVSWERYRMYWVGPKEQVRCLESELRYEPE